MCDVMDDFWVRTIYSILVAESYTGGSISFVENADVSGSTWESLEKLHNGEVRFTIIIIGITIFVKISTFVRFSSALRFGHCGVCMSV